MKKIKKNIKRKWNGYGGYSFIEGVVATFIVTAGMLAVIQLMTASLAVLFNSRDQTAATFLAQEGAEIVRNIRDNNWAAAVNTFNGPNFPTAYEDSCRVDIYSTQIRDNVECNSGDDSKILQKSSTTGVYLHNSSFPNSKFKRKIIIAYDTGSKDTASTATATSVVVWGNTSIPVALADCTLLKKCVFVRVVLNKWGGTD